MEQRPITFNLLNKDELEYEVKIRGAKPADTVVALKAQIRSLNKDMPSDEILSCDLDINTELKIIQKKLDELDKLISSSAGKPSSLKMLNRIQNLAHHLFHRMGRLSPIENDDNGQNSLLTSLQNRLDSILGKIDNILHNFKSSLTPDQPMVTSNLPTQSTNNDSSVHKLNLRFNGKTCIKAFLQRLEELCLSRGLPESKLFCSAAELFTDEALCWYRGIKSDIHNWVELKTLLLDEYLPSDYDHRLLQEIRSRTQGTDESIVNYLSIMQNYFSRLSKPISEEEKLNIVMFNIRPFYTTQLALSPVESWNDLKRKCRFLENARERTAHFSEPPKVTTSFLAPDLGYKRHKSPPRVSAIQPSNGLFCVRCRVNGHSLKGCRAPWLLICYRCGEKGFNANNCPKCAPPKQTSTGVSKNFRK